MCHSSNLTDEQQVTLFSMSARQQSLFIHELERAMDDLGIRNTKRNAPRIQQTFEAMLKRLSEPVAIGA